MLKLAVSMLLLTLSIAAQAQTSSRFRNEVNANVSRHEARIQEACTAHARERYNAQEVDLRRPQSWFYTYEIKFLNDCYFNVKMRLMDTHATLLRSRIAKLRREAQDRNDRSIARDAALLTEHLNAFLEDQRAQRRRYETNDYNWRGQDGRTQILTREIKQVLTAHYEMRAEMRWEGTL